MKHRILSFLACAGILSLVGCSMFTRPVYSVAPPMTNQVVTVTPQVPKIELATNAAGTTITNWITLPPVVVTNTVVTPGQSVTSYVVNPTLTSGIVTAQQLNGAFNPTPTAPLVNLGLGALALLASGIAAWKTKVASGESALKATLQTAIETFPGVGSLKDHVANISQITGTSDALHASVQDQFPGKVKIIPPSA